MTISGVSPTAKIRRHKDYGMTKEISENARTEFLLYKTSNNCVKVEVLLQNETIWLTQDKNRTSSILEQVQNEDNTVEWLEESTKLETEIK